MIFKQVFDQKSSTYTYIIASAEGREALIIDPVLENVEDYIKLLNELNLKLVKVIDTHIHADHVTGAGKLRDKTQCVTIMGEHTPTDAVEIKVKDEEIIKLEHKIAYLETTIKYIDGVLRSIQSRGWDIKNAISWKQFEAGMS